MERARKAFKRWFTEKDDISRAYDLLALSQILSALVFLGLIAFLVITAPS